MWPIFLYMTKDECLRSLRQLELDAYSMLVSALRAQGALTPEKRKVLRDVCKVLNINPDRHKCEVRRAVNDEKLNTIAYQMNGLDVSIEEWCQEGRRVLPILQRISPHTLHPIITEEMAKTSGIPQSCPEGQHSEGLLEELRDDSANDLDRDLGNNMNMLEKPPRVYRSSANQADALEPEKTYSAKKVINQNHKLMVVSNAESTSTNSILHKTLSVPISKVTKINLDKFKIVPSSFSPTFQVSNAANVNKSFITNKAGKRIIPLSQLQMLNHKLSSKGGIKVLPISSKILGKNITMTRITNNQGLKTPILHPFVSSTGDIPTLSKIKVENIEMLHDITSQIDQRKQTQDAVNEEDLANEDVNRQSNNNEAAVENFEEVDGSKKDKSRTEQNDSGSLMELDSNELIEPELKEAPVVVKE